MNDIITFTDNQDHVLTRGIDWGYGVGNKLNVKYRTEKYHIWHKPSNSDWSGRGSISGFPALYFLVEIKEGNKGKIIKEVEPGRHYRVAVKELIEQIRILTNS